MYFFGCLLGALPNMLGWSAPWQVAGWGLWMPGAGFVALGGWWVTLFPLSLLLFTAGLFLWVVSGNMLVWVAVWLLSTVAAAMIATEHSAPYTAWVIVPLAIAYLARARLKNKTAFRTALKRGERGNQALPEVIRHLQANASPHLDSNTAELTPDQLHAARYLFDRCLQPVGKLEGFVQTDPFQFSAYHYQLAVSQYALSILQREYAPSFHGYLNQAQRYTIESLALPEVCGYWKWENLWGNFRWSPDPVNTKDNIMLTGWAGVCLNTYAANTGDKRYGVSGCLPFQPSRNSKRRFHHDTHSFLKSVTSNWDNSKAYMLYPCEPGFSYSVCNMYAMNALIAYDRAWGTQLEQRYRPKFMQRLIDEFELADGRFQQGYSERFGLTIVFQPFVNGDAGIAVQLNALDPALGWRAYALLRFEHVKLDAQGNLSISWVDPLDTLDANWRTSGRSFACAQLIIAAREYGDEALAEHAWDIVRANYESPSNGKFGFQGASTPSQLMLAWSTFHTRDAWRNVIRSGPGKGALEGPLLADCSYPEVLVARARSIDGESLDLVLYNGGSAGPQQVTVERLKPQTQYEMVGATTPTIASDATGAAMFSVNLQGRTAVSLRPCKAE
jgi:hypothetical protein